MNNPKRHGHKVPDINQEVLLSLFDAVNSHLEKSYGTRTNFKPVKNVLGNIIEICVKYSDYPTKNKHIQVEYRVNDEEEPQYKKAIFRLPTIENLNTYKVERERNAIVSLKEALKDKNFYKPVSVDIHFPERRSYRYVFIRNRKNCGIPIVNTILFAKYYEGSHGNRYFMWREKTDADEHLTERNGVIDSVTKMLPKYFSRAHKNKMRLLTERVMLDKISPAQFRFIYQEITGDNSKADTQKQAEYDERIRCIIKNADPTLCRDLRVNNGKKNKV